MTKIQLRYYILQYYVPILFQNSEFQEFAVLRNLLNVILNL